MLLLLLMLVLLLLLLTCHIRQASGQSSQGDLLLSPPTLSPPTQTPSHALPHAMHLLSAGLLKSLKNAGVVLLMVAWRGGRREKRKACVCV